MRKWKMHLLLFLLTVLTTLFAGAYYIQDYDLFKEFPRYLLPGLLEGVPFSMPLLLILGSHEFAHYFNSRRHHVEATLPYFIPFPNLFGTLGAVIKMKSRILDRRALIDIGASGPLVGFVLAVIACAVGLSLSEAAAIKPLESGETVLGGSILYVFLMKLFVHADLATQTVKLHPVAVAGWVGLFVTSINLMPVGQLDGGHIAYAFFARHHKRVSQVFILALALMGLVFPGWIIWAALLMFVLGVKHPPVMDPSAPLDWKRKLIGALSLVVFVITFTPAPVYIAP
jgi:membrane-associated protease RseP (regulator of RpoE activity)